MEKLSEDQISNMGEFFEWPNSYWFIAERTNGRLAMIGILVGLSTELLTGQGILGQIGFG